MSIVMNAAMNITAVAALPSDRAGEPGPPYALQDGKPILTTSNVVGAVSVPPLLGPRVLSWTRMLFTTGPVLVSAESAGPQQWIFLCRPDSWPSARAAAELADASVWACPPHTEIVLPRALGRARDGGCRWVEPPGDEDVLPDQARVVYAARRAIAQRQAELGQ